MSEPNFFERRGVVAAFGILALLGGIYFIQPAISGNVTGNAIVSDTLFNIVPIIGILLLICSIILLAYAAVKKN
ncbi:hypothetical protein HYT23_02665 [Candidatus Pacearchaeota archaeon]|nr:hypothetical protein [Candidatus Pacearchaeota archaeon]